jgi:hypothetical protein|tara:strand:- start:26792 stop:26992 length:201 start_codon:yes stop_codon:yes gene_type:complete
MKNKIKNFLKLLKKLFGLWLFSVTSIITYNFPIQPMETQQDINFNWIIVLIIFFSFCLSSMLIFED